MTIRIAVLRNNVCFLDRNWIAAGGLFVGSVQQLLVGGSSVTWLERVVLVLNLQLFDVDILWAAEPFSQWDHSS